MNISKKFCYKVCTYSIVNSSDKLLRITLVIPTSNRLLRIDQQNDAQALTHGLCKDCLQNELKEEKN